MSHINPKVSILIPIFNVEKYLRECLDSVVNQTLKNIEIICINDGSTDNSLKIIREYATRDSRFVVINKKNSGYGDSMNKGIAKATGEYIGIVESDDFADPDMFRELYKLAYEYKADVVKSNFFYYYTDIDNKSPQWDEKLSAVYNTEQHKVITSHNTKCQLVRQDETGRIITPRKNQHIFYQKPAIWSAIYKKDFLQKSGIEFLATPGASYQDTAFSFKVWAKADKVVFTDKAYLHYRQDNEASSVNSPGKVFCVSDEYKGIEDFLKKNDLYEQLGSLAQKTKYGAYMWNFNRLAEDLDADFLKVFSQEYLQADESGVLDYTYFDNNERRDLREIMHTPQLFLKRKYARKKAKISVIVPVYDVEKYLPKCLDNLIDQTFKDIEILCVNDGSPDNSLSILEEYHAKDSRIVIRETPNRGLAAARNHGIARASGEFLMFCDSDDYFSLDACEKMYKAIVNNDTDIAMGGTNVIYTDPKLNVYRRTDEEYFRLKYNKKIQITDHIIKRTDVSAWNKIYRSSIQKKYDVWFPNGLWYEDARFFNDYMLVSGTAFYLRGVKVYNYIRRPESIMGLTAKKTPRAIDHIKIIFESFLFMKKHNLLEEHQELFVDNFTKYYKLSLRYMPNSEHHKLYELVRTFIKVHGSYLDSINPALKQEIIGLLPKQSVNERFMKGIKAVLRKPVKRILPKISILYRRQDQIIMKLDELAKKVEYIERSNDKSIGLLRQEIKQVQEILRK